jgi:hypothetical protein
MTTVLSEVQELKALAPRLITESAIVTDVGFLPTKALAAIAVTAYVLTPSLMVDGMVMAPPAPVATEAVLSPALVA